jgi:fermentation-respiration switch protein FrsA (DUF1100 family)
MAIGLAILAALGLAARFTGLIDRYFIYYPDKELTRDPGDAGLDYEDVTFTTADGLQLHGWFVPGESEMTLFWFHGNAGNIGHRVEHMAELHARLGLSIFIFDYRGYGRSEGSPSERGTYLDADAALAYLRSRPDVDGQKIVFFGHSLGSAIAVEAAVGNSAYAVVLESPFTSIQAMAKRAYPFLPGVGALVRTRYDTLAKIKGVNAPLLVLHGDRDDTVPLDMGRELFEAANPPKRFYAVEGAGHSDMYVVGGSAYYDDLARFLADPTRDGS